MLGVPSGTTVPSGTSLVAEASLPTPLLTPTPPALPHWRLLPLWFRHRLHKGHMTHGMANAMLGKWEEAARDLNAASNIDYDDETNAALKKHCCWAYLLGPWRRPSLVWLAQQLCLLRRSVRRLPPYPSGGRFFFGPGHSIVSGRTFWHHDAIRHKFGRRSSSGAPTPTTLPFRWPLRIALLLGLPSRTMAPSDSSSA